MFHRGKEISQWHWHSGPLLPKTWGLTEAVCWAALYPAGACGTGVSKAQDRHQSGTCICTPQETKQNKTNAPPKKTKQTKPNQLQTFSLTIAVLLKLLGPHCDVCGKIPYVRDPLRAVHTAGCGWGLSRCALESASRHFLRGVWKMHRRPNSCDHVSYSPEIKTHHLPLKEIVTL